jgi:alcohol dehydrogenase, propanol-preferring
MKTLRLVDWKTDPELAEVPKPTPGPSEVIVRIGGAGACHSDLHVMHDFEPGMMPWKVPLTLGHENAGWVDSVGDGVTTVEEGDAVAVYGAGVAASAAGASRASRTTARIRPRHRFRQVAP